MTDHYDTPRNGLLGQSRCSRHTDISLCVLVNLLSSGTDLEVVHRASLYLLPFLSLLATLSKEVFLPLIFASQDHPPGKATVVWAQSAPPPQ